MDRHGGSNTSCSEFRLSFSKDMITVSSIIFVYHLDHSRYSIENGFMLSKKVRRETSYRMLDRSGIKVMIRFKN